MVRLYAARIEDLGPGDYVPVECTECGHDIERRSAARRGLPLPPHTPILDLERWFRRRECDAKGKAVVSIKWAA
jgi:hypothetical protein